MKKIVQRAREIGSVVAGAIRHAIDPPLDADAKPLDFKRAILEAVERQVEPAGGGRRISPATRVIVRLWADARTQQALRAVLKDIRADVVARLRELRCDAPPGFDVEVSYVRRQPSNWAPDQRIAIAVVSDSRKPGAVTQRPTQTAIKLTVVNGTATRNSYTFLEHVISIGRSERPVDDRGKARPNQIAFHDDSDAANKTVTRVHASIRFDRSIGSYRIFDEGSSNGTRIIRGGAVIDVPKHDPIGVVLASGDEIQLGKASLRVRLAADTCTE